MQDETKRLEHILNAIHCGIWEWDLVTNEVILDKRWAEIGGYTLADLQPIDAYTSVNLTHPNDREIIRLSAEAHLAGKTDRFSCETRMRHKNGQWIWVLDNGIIIERNDKNEPTKMIGARQDITDRKAAEEIASQEIKRFKALTAASKTGVWEWNNTTQSLWCSHEYFSMLGYDEKDFPKEKNLDSVWKKLLHPDDLENASRTFSSYLNSNTKPMYESEFRLKHATGKWIWVVSRGSTIKDDNNNPTNLTVGAHIDITSLKEAQEQFQESEERLKAISDNLPGSMVFRLDCGVNGESRQFTYISQGVKRHGYTAEQVMANANLLYEKILPQYRQAMTEKETECLKTMQVFRMEVEIKVPNGETRWFLISYSPKRLSNNRLVFDGIEIDINNVKQQEQKIVELNTQLEQRVAERTAELSSTLDNLQRAQDELLQNEKLASLGALVAGVSHELNTPIGNALMVASSYAEAHKKIKKQLETGLTRSSLDKFLGEIDEGNNIIERNLYRAAELIRSFKQLAVDQTSYQRRQFDLKTLSHEIAVTLHPTLRKSPYTLQDDFCNNVTFDSYPGPLGQVLINLINNSIIHGFDGRSSGTIRLQCDHYNKDWVKLTISDNGNGIPKKNQKKIFDPFFTTQLGKGGSGLGLHIIYTLVTGLLGGRIELNSKEGQGTKFILHLPLVAPENLD